MKTHKIVLVKWKVLAQDLKTCNCVRILKIQNVKNPKDDMFEDIKHLSQRKCTKDLYMESYFLGFRPIKEIVFLSRGKGFWLLLSNLDKKSYVFSDPPLLREVLG